MSFYLFITVHKADPTHPRTVYVLFLLIFSIPGLSLYIGYLIGNTYQGYNGKLPKDQVVVKHVLLNTSLKYSHYLAMDISGGLGNIMFQYASLYGICKSNAMIPALDKKSSLLTVFPSLPIKLLDEIQPVELWSHFLEAEPAMYDQRALSLNFGKNILLKGRFRSWRYFDNSKDDLRRQFTFISSTEYAAEQFLTHTYVLHRERFPDTNSEVKFIGIHVKRGDNAIEHNTGRGYGADSRDYIKRAMNFFGAKFQHIVFVITSDNKRWSKNYIKSRKHLVVHSPHQSASLDLCILSKCNHTIITIGTFGWWAAFLANGETVYKKNSPARDSPLAQGFLLQDFYYPHWIGL